MKFFKRLQRFSSLGCLLLLALGTIEAKNHKGDKLLKLAQKAEQAKDWDIAVDDYDQALATEPQEPSYLMADRRAHSAASQWHVEQGRIDQREQRFNEALVQFQRAVLLDASAVAFQEIRATNEMLRKQKESAPGTQILTPAQQARQDLEKRLNSLESPPQLRPITDMMRNVRMNNEPVRILYETVGKLAGINVLLDPTGVEAVPGKNFNLDLNNVTLEEALNYIALETHTFWKAISRNAIFVTQESEPKRQEYQDEIVKVFYVQNSTSQAEFTEIFNAVRTASKINQGLFQVQNQNAIVARGTPDALAIIEKLVHDLDKPKSEVLVDVVIMEVSKLKTQTIGAALLGQGGLSLPVNFTPRNPVTIGTGSGSGTTTTTTGTTGTTSGTTTGTTGTTTTTGTGTTTSGSTSGNSSYFTIASLGHISSADFSTSLPSTLLQAIMSDATSRILQRPQVRCTDGGKAELKIGQKIPYVSGSLNSVVSTGTTPYSTTQFQQIDVGVNITLQPHVNGPEDLSMHLKVEISNQATPVVIAGIQEPVITQRSNEADIRMKDGEVGLLGGLSDQELSTTNSGFPGLTNIPVLGYLFGSKEKTKSDDEILIALIPHIVRGPDYNNGPEGGVYAGSETRIHVMRRPDGSLDVVDGAASQAAPNAPIEVTPGLATNPPVPQPAPANNTAPAVAPGQQRGNPVNPYTVPQSQRNLPVPSVVPSAAPPPVPSTAPAPSTQGAPPTPKQTPPQQ